MQNAPIGRLRTSEYYELPSGSYVTIGQNQIWQGAALLQSTPVKLTGQLQLMARKRQCSDQIHVKHGGKYTEGGPLDILLVHRQHYPVEGILAYSKPPSYPGTRYVYQGAMYASFNGATGVDWALPTAGFGDISQYGAQAWNKFKPGKQQADLAQFIGELRDMPHMLKQTADYFRQFSTMRRKGNAGADYLNLQFGWLPFLRDLKKMYVLSQNLNREITKLIKHNGQWVRRKGTVFETKDTTSWEKFGAAQAQGTIPALSTYLASGHTVYGTVDYGRRVWFSGSFRYYIPPFKIGNVWWRRNYLRKLYGLTITPQLVWELTPWSWLADYFANIGDVISNISSGAISDVVAKQAYVMGTTSRRVVQKSQVTLNGYGSVGPVITHETVYKQRVAASPYGFGISESGLSPFQMSILAALGYSKFR